MKLYFTEDDFGYACSREHLKIAIKELNDSTIEYGFSPDDKYDHRKAREEAYNKIIKVLSGRVNPFCV